MKHVCKVSYKSAQQFQRKRFLKNCEWMHGSGNGKKMPVIDRQILQMTDDNFPILDIKKLSTLIKYSLHGFISV